MFGELVRTHRARLGLTQEDLAGNSGVGLRTIRDIESGRVGRSRPATVRLLADALTLHGPDRDRFYRSALSDPVGAGPDASDDPSEPVGPPTPAQLPADVAGFTGRDHELADLEKVLIDTPDRPAIGISVVTGPAGVGKTALAVHWAHRAAAEFPDGQLYVNLRGFAPGAPPMDAAEAVRGFLDALQVPPRRIPVGLDAQAALYRSLLTGRRMLVLLDNARDAEQVRPLLPGGPECRVLVTSRNRLSGLVTAVGAHVVTLDLLSDNEGRDLLVRRLGEDRLAADPQAVQDILTQCVGLPLALAIVAARAAAHSRFPLAALADQLREARGGLDAFDGEDPATDARSVFSWSYHSVSTGSARLFRLLGVHPGPDVSAAAAASLAGVPLREARRLLTELATAHLIAEHAPGRFTFHDLLRAYVGELMSTVESEPERSVARERMFDHYLHSADAAMISLNPYRQPLMLGKASAGVTAEEFTEEAGALAWFATEHAVLSTVIEETVRYAADAWTWRLAWTLNDFLERAGLWRMNVRIQQLALRATQRLADRAGQARIHRTLAGSYIDLREYADGETQLRQSLRLFEELGDSLNLAHTYISLSVLHSRQGRYGNASLAAQRAFEVFEAAGHLRGQARSLNNIGWYRARLGQYRQALAECERAAALNREIGDLHGEAAALDSVGYIHQHLGDHHRAVACYEKAIEIYREVGSRSYEAESLTRLGDTYHGTGDQRAARDSWREALGILDELGHPDADQLRAKLGEPGSSSS